MSKKLSFLKYGPKSADKEEAGKSFFHAKIADCEVTNSSKGVYFHS